MKKDLDEDFDPEIDETKEEADKRRLLLKEILTPKFNQTVNAHMAKLAEQVGSRLCKEVKESWEKLHLVGKNLRETSEEIEEGEEPEFVLEGSLEETLVCLTTHLSKKYTDPTILKTFPGELVFEAEEGCFLAKYKFGEDGRPLIEVSEEPLEAKLVYRKKGAVTEQKRDELAKVRRLAGLPPKPEKQGQPLDESKLTSEERHARVLAGLAVYDVDGTNMLAE